MLVLHLCDRGAFLNCRTSETGTVFLKNIKITKVYIHSRVRYGFYHMPIGRKAMDSLDQLNFELLQGFFDSSY